MNGAPRNPVLRFGSFEFEVRNGVLRRGGKRVQLQPQPAKILALLVTRPGEVVTREELRQQIWDDHTFVDFEHCLNYSVRQIRAALSDNPEKPRFIETLSRRGYRFIAPLEPASPEPEKAVRSLAVLPLENLSHDPEQEYFADGMTDELITALAKIGSLRVISRTSIQQYKRVRGPLPDIARQLNVDAIVEGTVTRHGNRVRITAQLINPKPETHLWAETYERDISDVLKLQAEVAAAIAGQIQVKLTEEEQWCLKTAAHVDPAAFELYLRGRYFWNKRTEENLVKAAHYFEQAIEKQPGYALAWSGLADTYFYRGYVFGKLAPPDAMPEAKQAALRAMALGPGQAESHVSLGLVSEFFDWNWQAAEKEYKAALRLNPNYATAHHMYAGLLTITGRRLEAVAESRRALEIDPLSIPINNFVGQTLAFAGHFDAAIEQFRKTIEMDSSVWLPHWNLGIWLEEAGNHAEAVDEYLKANQCSGTSGQVLTELRAAYDRRGLRGFRQLQLETDLHRWNGWHLDTFHIAAHYAQLGELENALAWLERACAARSGGIVWMKSFPFFKNLYSHPHFENIALRVGLPG